MNTGRLYLSHSSFVIMAGLGAKLLEQRFWILRGYRQEVEPQASRAQNEGTLTHFALQFTKKRSHTYRNQAGESVLSSFSTSFLKRVIISGSFSRARFILCILRAGRAGRPK